MEGYDTSDGACAAHGPDRADFPAQEPGLEDALYRAIQDTASGRNAGKEQFVRVGEELARRVAGYLLRQYPGLLDPAMADPNASVRDVADVIFDLWYEALFADAGWRLLRAPDDGGVPSAYLWQIARRHLLRREAHRYESLGFTCVDLPPPGLPERQAWEYVRQTNSLSQCADSIAEEVLSEQNYLVFHDRIWGCGDDGDRMTYREIGEKHGISEDAVCKRFQRAEERMKKYVRDHPEDARVQELERVQWVDGLRVLE